MPLRIGLLACSGLVLLCAAGCTLMNEPVGKKSPLAQARPSPDSFALEVFFARFPHGDKEINGGLWTEIDELAFPADLRRELAQNGFRLGLIGSHLPPQLVKLLHLKDTPTTADEKHVVPLENEPNVNLRVIQTRSGKRNEIVASSMYDSLPLLKREDGQVRGQTYLKADGRFGLRAYSEPGGGIRLELLPELHHGEQQTRWVGSDGVMRLEAGRPRVSFDEMKISTPLAPGQMLVITSRVDKPGSLGHYFFTEPTSEKLSQKLLIVRLAQTGADQLFADEPKPLDLNFGE